MSSSTTALAAAIAGETRALQEFVAILETEQKLLISGDADAVLPLLERKTALIATLGVTGQQRDTALRELGLTDDKAEIEAFFSHAGKAHQEAWHALLELAQSAKRLNTTNGTLINSRLQSNQQALSILMQASGDSQGDSGTYGPDGIQKHGTGSRTLGSA